MEQIKTKITAHYKTITTEDNELKDIIDSIVIENDCNDGYGYGLDVMYTSDKNGKLPSAAIFKLLNLIRQPNLKITVNFQYLKTE